MKMSPERNRDNGLESQSPVRVFFIRHSKATYATYAEKLASEYPETPLDLDSQLPDLPESGKELARENAQIFFSKFNPEDSVVYVVSSNQMRALETAGIYIDVAEENGFGVVTQESPEHITNNSKIRTIENLSLHRGNQVLDSVFNSSSYMPKINWSAVDVETREKFARAREIVEADDKGSWGANFYAHADAIKEIIPDIETPSELHETQYKNLQRLADFARDKVSGDKKVIVLAFGHENYMGQAMQHETGDHGVANTEVIEFSEDGHLSRFDH